VCWGKGRLARASIHEERGNYATWTWPRGVMLYVRREVVSKIGGMDERFGPGGHEHVEWSKRIHAAGFTPADFCTPPVYAHVSKVGRAMGAHSLWHCEDMPREGEHTMDHRHRKRGQTSIRREPGDWDAIEKVLASREGDTSFVSFRAEPNGRQPATVGLNLTGRGAGGETSE
jgi:hypothetical protein